MDFLKRKFSSKVPCPGDAKHALYRMGRVLGQGTYGRVKEAVVIATNKRVAVKSIIKREGSSNKVVAREIDILKRIRHPCVIQLLDSFETSQKYYLVFELVTGGELFDRIAMSGKLTEVDATRIIYKVLDAVACFHDEGIVHRDLKPENILLRDDSEDSDIVVADFGVSNASVCLTY